MGYMLLLFLGFVLAGVVRHHNAFRSGLCLQGIRNVFLACSIMLNQEVLSIIFSFFVLPHRSDVI